MGSSIVRNIVEVNVYLDDNVPEYMNGIIRAGSVISVDENGDEFDHQELINNDEFTDEGELIQSIAESLDVDPGIISVEG